MIDIGSTTQTVGVIAIAVMMVTGLASISDVTKRGFVVQRMLHYQAEEVALNAEMMQSWDRGRIQMELDFPTNVSIYSDRNLVPAESVSNPEASPGYDSFADPQNQFITLTRHGESASTVMATVQENVNDNHFQASIICIRKNAAGFFIQGGTC